jgi:hypothetical protein
MTESAAERKARLDRIFGETEPSQTSDDRDDAPASNDRHLRENVPPHHG